VAVVLVLDPVGPALGPVVVVPERVVLALELGVLVLVLDPVLVRVVAGLVLEVAVAAEVLRVAVVGRRAGGAGLLVGVRVARVIRRTGIGMRVLPRTGGGLPVLEVMTSLRGTRSVGRCPARVDGTTALVGTVAMLGAGRGAGLVRVVA
jgi:hypothetical protein